MSSPLEHDPIILPLVDGNTILDVACGRGKWGYLLRVNWWCTARGTGDTEPKMLVGVDIFLPFLRKVKYHRIYDDVVLCHASYFPFKDNSFDVVLASEILEHVERVEGKLLLQEAERVSRRTVIVGTPHILRKRGGLPTPEGFNPYERHINKWSIKELRSLGYRVVGTGFLPFALFPVLNSLLSPISFLIPHLSTHLIARKNVRKNRDSLRS